MSEVTPTYLWKLPDKAVMRRNLQRGWIRRIAWFLLSAALFCVPISCPLGVP